MMDTTEGLSVPGAVVPTEKEPGEEPRGMKAGADCSQDLGVETNIEPNNEPSVADSEAQSRVALRRAVVDAVTALVQVATDAVRIAAMPDGIEKHQAWVAHWPQYAQVAANAAAAEADVLHSESEQASRQVECLYAFVEAQQNKMESTTEPAVIAAVIDEAAGRLGKLQTRLGAQMQLTKAARRRAGALQERVDVRTHAKTDTVATYVDKKVIEVEQAFAQAFDVVSAAEEAMRPPAPGGVVISRSQPRSATTVGGLGSPSAAGVAAATPSIPEDVAVFETPSKQLDARVAVLEAHVVEIEARVEWPESVLDDKTQDSDTADAVKAWRSQKSVLKEAACARLEAAKAHRAAVAEGATVAVEAQAAVALAKASVATAKASLSVDEAEAATHAAALANAKDVAMRAGNQAELERLTNLGPNPNPNPNPNWNLPG